MAQIRFFVFTLVALLGLGLSATSAQAATELYLQFEPALHGSSKDAAHGAWILLDSYSFGDGSAAGAGGARGSGAGAGDRGGLPDKGAASDRAGAGDKGGLPTKGGAGDPGGLPTKGGAGVGGAGDKGARPTKITFVTSDLTVLAELRASVVKGQHFKTATLEVKKPGKGSSEYLKITLTDVLVSSAVLRPGPSSRPNEASFTLTFVRETADYSKADASGNRGAVQPMPATWDITTAKAE